MSEFTITQPDKGTRIDLFLTKQSTLSRAQLQKLIKSGRILVNQKNIKTNYRLQTGDQISVPELETGHPPVRLSEIPILEIIYEDDDLLVMNKPAGLIVHAHAGFSGKPTVVDALIKRYPGFENIGENPVRPGIVHRLDKNVSGLMVIAKTQEAFASLKKQFQNRTVYKEYVALVYGTLPKNHDVIEMNIARSRAQGKMVARPKSQEGKEALTEYIVKQRFKNHTLVQVILHTGRTHQIRVHFRAIDHPIVGDELYKKTHMKHIRPISLNRIFLHAHTLRITLLNNHEREFTAPLPSELQQLLTTLH